MSKLSREALEKFLALLDLDSTRAGEKYQKLREKLIRIFESRGCHPPEDYADETIYRVVEKIDAGVEIRNINSYLTGVVQRILQECWRSRRNREPVEALSPSKEPSEDPREVTVREAAQRETERMEGCLDECLQQFRPQDRSLVIRFYRGEGREKIENRKNLADRLGISPNALRIRAHRARQELEECIRNCLEEH